MRHYLIAFSLLSSLLLVGCSGIKYTSDNHQKVAAPLAIIQNTALYKVDFEVFGDHLSGVVLFKHNVENEDFNIVFLSEIGLTLCEFYVSPSASEVVSAGSLFQNKAAQRTLLEDFSLLTKAPGSVKQISESSYKNREHVRYTLSENSELKEIRKKRFINGIFVRLSSYEKGLPTQILFEHRGIKFNMKLTLLKQK